MDPTQTAAPGLPHDGLDDFETPSAPAPLSPGNGAAAAMRTPKRVETP